MDIGITGTAGVGKSLFAGMLKKSIPSFTIIELNDVANKYDLFSGTDKEGTKIVKIAALNSKVKGLLEEAGGGGVALVGHLLPELNLKLDMVFVVRADLEELIKRLEARGYRFEKIRENIIAEALDYCGVNSGHISNDLFEIEGKAGMERAIDSIMARMGGSEAAELPRNPIDKMPELFSLIKGANKYRF